MKNISKQFEGWDTPSEQSNFKKAVILLTIYYTTGVFIVLAIFNLMVYGLFTNSIKTGDNERAEKINQQINGIKIKESSAKEMQDNLLNILLTSDAVILIITLLVAYLSSKRTLKPLEEAYKKQSRFVADAAHELRTPLSVMKAGGEVILRSNRSKDEYTKYIKESLEEVDRLTTLSNDLLFLASNNKKKVKSNTQVNIGEICKKQIEIMRAYANVKNIKIEDNIEDNLILEGEKEDLTRLIINLLKNAVDYNKQGGKIIISLKKKNNKIILSIEDTGIGIKKEDINQIFERFYKADNSRTQNSSSTGLGLSIVKEIIDEHHGLIEVNSQIDKGTTFTVTLSSI
ncbi:MAG: HAMP domain-containing sensor histidine kinase [Candidatus Nomurabacteria bacterium]